MDDMRKFYKALLIVVIKRDIRQEINMNFISIRRLPSRSFLMRLRIKNDKTFLIHHDFVRRRIHRTARGSCWRPSNDLHRRIFSG